MSRLKGSISKPEPTCYTPEADCLGINFKISRDLQLFAPYSFLSHIQMNEEKEIYFYYTYGTIQVKGHRLAELYTLARRHHLGAICQSAVDDPCRAEIEIREVSFTKLPYDLND